MTKADSKQRLIDAMGKFNEAYYEVLRGIEDYERENKSSVNDIKGFTEKYPFDKSFDELDVHSWVIATAESLEQSKFNVLNYEYLNTGGNCMVGIFEVWLPADLKTVYVFVNEEGYTMSVVDYIRNELDIDDYDELTIEYGDWGRVTGFEKHFELYRHCLMEYTKSDCRAFKQTRELPKYLLSDELQEQITVDYQRWMDSNEYDSFETDGEKIIINPLYKVASSDEEMLEAIKEFKRWHDTTAGVEKYYEEMYKLEFAGHKIELPFMADVWDAVDEMLNRTISDW